MVECIYLASHCYYVDGAEYVAKLQFLLTCFILSERGSAFSSSQVVLIMLHRSPFHKGPAFSSEVFSHYETVFSLDGDRSWL